jgi:hypothetical protein
MARPANRLLLTVSRPMAGALGAAALSLPVLIAAALLPQSLEQAVLAASGVLLLVSGLLSAGILAAGRFLHLDRRADDVVEVGRDRALLPGARPRDSHWVRPAALPQAPAPEVPAPAEPVVDVRLPRQPAIEPVEGAKAGAATGR